MARIIIPDGRIQPPTVTPNGNPIDAGIWQIDGHGRKYRKIGNGAIEYMPTITIDGVTIENTQEAITAFHERNKAAKEAFWKQENQRQQEINTGKFCPFDRWASFPPQCKRDCALFNCERDSCGLAGRTAAKDAQGKPCPFMRQCNPACALYNAGCTLNNTIPAK